MNRVPLTSRPPQDMVHICQLATCMVLRVCSAWRGETLLSAPFQAFLQTAEMRPRCTVQ
jgi:hypothetical protein